MFVNGQVPDTAPKKDFQAEDFNEDEEFEDGLDLEDYDNLDFDEHWN